MHAKRKFQESEGDIGKPLFNTKLDFMDMLFDDPSKCQKCKDADVKLRLSTLYLETNGISIPMDIPKENFKPL